MKNLVNRCECQHGRSVVFIIAFLPFEETYNIVLIKTLTTMEKKNLESLMVAFNMRRQGLIGQRLTRSEMLGELKAIGFSKSQISQLMNKGYIRREKSGKNASKLYSFMDSPLNIKQMENLSLGTSSTKSKFNEKEAIHQLQINGFKVLKPIGFDEEKFRKENPELYKKYLVYESI